ncbi:MAG: BlaI/MecI/CopY family transcriptional regulator [Spirochaetales bacterium]|nr:BlaI/MecI/CopY family transcriptional regulator [Spirochaetales bacterium]
MMKKRVADLELKILNRLWEMDNSGTVQDVIDSWMEDEKPGYTTILKKLQIMEGKGLIRHEKQGKAYSYIPLISKKDVSRNRIENLLTGVFSGNKLDFAHAFFEDAGLSKDELAEIRKMLDRFEKGGGDESTL